MSLDLFIGIAGVLVTLLVVAGMILITPHGATTRPRPAPEAEDAEAEAAAAAPVPAPRPSLADV